MHLWIGMFVIINKETGWTVAEGLMTFMETGVIKSQYHWFLSLSTNNFCTPSEKKGHPKSLKCRAFSNHHSDDILSKVTKI